MDRSMIDAASGGALMDKTPAAARQLISNMASNTQQFRIRGASQPRMVNEIGAMDNLLANRVDVIGEATCCWTTPTKHSSQIWKAATLARAESRAICSSTIRTCPKCISRTNRLSTTNYAISSATIPTTTIENGSSRQFTISRGPNEAISNKQSKVSTNHDLQQYAVSAKYDCHHPRPQDADRTLAGSSNLPSHTISNLRGNASAVTLRSGKTLPQPTPQKLPRLADADSEPDANSQMP
ncbi:hypothetical protein CR513_08226, partial [Mucuna pruriens]